MIDDGVSCAECWIAGAAGASLLPLNLKPAALALARRHGRVTARLMQTGGGEGGDGGSFVGHVLRGYASLSMGETEGAALLAAVGHAQSLGEMLMRVQLNYKKYDNDAIIAEKGGGGGGRGGVEHVKFGAVSAPSANHRKVVLQGEPTGMYCAPIARLRAFEVTPAEPTREAAAAAAAAAAALLREREKRERVVVL